MLYLREEIPLKLIQPTCRKLDTEYFLAEINLRRKKWLLVCNYNPHKTPGLDCLEYISKEMNSLSTKYDNILLLKDFNSEPTEGKGNVLPNT